MVRIFVFSFFLAISALGAAPPKNSSPFINVNRSLIELKKTDDTLTPLRDELKARFQKLDRDVQKGWSEAVGNYTTLLQSLTQDEIDAPEKNSVEKNVIMAEAEKRLHELPKESYVGFLHSFVHSILLMNEVKRRAPETPAEYYAGGIFLQSYNVIRALGEPIVDSLKEILQRTEGAGDRYSSQVIRRAIERIQSDTTRKRKEILEKALQSK